VTAADLDALRREGFSDEAIHRIADGLGVDREEWMPEKTGRC
jgi:hypothetical protein